MNSIRSRLLLWIGLPFSLVGILTLIASQVVLSRQINETFDAMLLNAAERVERRIHTVEGVLRINMHYFSISTLGSRGDGKIFYRIRDDAGNMLAGFEGLEAPASDTTTPTFYDTRYAGNELRAVATSFPVVRGTQNRRIEVIVAESTEARDTLINEFLLTLSGLTALGGLLAVSIALLAIHRGLAPLHAISRSLRQRSPNDLDPIETQVPREVTTLVASINGLMARMRQSILNTQQFNADVSHQLRTPVSEIRALAEVTAQGCEAPSLRYPLKEIERIAEQAGHTVQQLLVLAKTRHELVDTQALTPLHLGEVCREACAEAAARIYQRGQELELIEQQTDEVIGDPVRLRWLVQNLIENASQHAGGEAPYRGTIRVSTFQRDGAPALSVADDGVGVAAEHLTRLVLRFYRASPTTPGSGLGLAIVDEVARAHGAHLEFSTPPGQGLTVSVVFAPRLDADVPAPSAAG
ncbi:MULTISPECIES: sensor histidine kinase [unclassified Halomonas]|uniref:sensor histidine kinase n=1 Tax=unclassified Halomonas TaxID=2609666 RepID=UPI00288535F8|nr:MULTISPECIES: sensor histidine kinase [unclassified Halomonas]MDT0499540.1 sensor histidine kinase [Halomonas sp. PAR7]MDT0510643.1 sensor histidine kinase [Halomonas sp. LES1]MDT0592344.1 sensor histidine kinase [Halomonas sp. PAR8]